MKKLLALLLALTMVLSLAACGSENNTDKDQNDQSQSENNAPTAKDPAAQTPSQGKEEVKPEPDKGSDSAKDDEPVQQPEAKPEAQPEEVPAITASHSDVTLKFAGETFKLTASNLPANCTVTYTSEDETIATVAEDGIVTAVASGTTNVKLHIEQDGVSYDFTCIVRCKWSDNTGADLNTYFNDFMASLGEGNAPFMVEMNEELMDAYYPGLTAIERKQTVMQMAGMSAVAFEFALVECANASDAEAVKGIFQARKDYQVDGGAWYPETIAAWEKAEVITSGNIVALISAGDAQQSAVDAFHTAFGK